MGKRTSSHLNEKVISDSRIFWHTVKPLLTDKNKSRENIILVTNEQITSDAVKVANTLNKFTQTSINISKFMNAMLRINFNIAYQCT